jgi:hypothetical protein
MPEDYIAKAALGISIIGIISSFCTAYYAFVLNEPYQIRRDPTLNHIWIDENVFGKWELERIGDQVTKIEVCFYNEGRAPTGHIYAHWDYGSIVGSGNLNIDNVPGGETRCDYISLIWYYDLCEEQEIGDRELNCNYGLIPNTTIIPLMIECKFCLEREFYRNFTFCFFDDSVPGGYNCE